MDLWITRGAERTVAAAASLIAVLLPWEVTYLGDIAGGSVLYLRFPVLEFQWSMGIASVEPIRVRLVDSAASLHQGGPLEPAYQAYLLGAGIVTLTLLLSIGLVVAERREGGVNPTKVVGGLLVLGGAVFLYAWWVILNRGAAGLDVPLGAVITPALGAVLVLAERRLGD
jgi:hypothetical protein